MTRGKKRISPAGPASATACLGRFGDASLEAPLADRGKRGKENEGRWKSPRTWDLWNERGWSFRVTQNRSMESVSCQAILSSRYHSNGFVSCGKESRLVSLMSGVREIQNHRKQNTRMRHAAAHFGFVFRLMLVTLQAHRRVSGFPRGVTYNQDSHFAHRKHSRSSLNAVTTGSKSRFPKLAHSL